MRSTCNDSKINSCCLKIEDGKIPENRNKTCECCGHSKFITEMVPIPIEGVLQTKFGVPEGNCFSACVATVLGLSIIDVPEFQCDYSDDGWWEKWLAWFAERGLKATVADAVPDGLAILNLNNPSHSVVVRDGKVIWNPHHNAPLPENAVPQHYITIRP